MQNNAQGNTQQEQFIFADYKNQNSKLRRKFVYKIGIVGPSRIGKTTLISTILKDLEKWKKEFDFVVEPFKDSQGRSYTRTLIKECDEEIESQVKAYEYKSMGVTTEKPDFFDLTVKPFDSNRDKTKGELRVVFLDYPGGYLSEGGENYNDCMQWIEDSSVLLVPIDASVIMEINNQKNSDIKNTMSYLEIEIVKKKIIDWALYRRKRKDSALLLFVPLKDEKYFSDNGGKNDESDKLYQRFQQFYGSICEELKEIWCDEDEEKNNNKRLAFMKKKYPKFSIDYFPIDTIGTIEYSYHEGWREKKTDAGNIIPVFECHFKLREIFGEGYLERKVFGAEDIFNKICEHIIYKRQNNNVFAQALDNIRGINKLLDQGIKKMKEKREQQPNKRYKNILEGLISKEK